MYDLSNFYQSKEWRRLMSTLKIERANEDGEIICNYCGKPITRAYDIIGHHKTELTDENCNDYNISLNPDNVALVHHRCHNYIHNKFGYKERQIFLIYGAPLSGKTSYVRESMNSGDLIIDMDNIWQCISGCDRYVKPNNLKSVAFKIRNELIECARYRNGKWRNVYIIGGYPIQSDRERLCKELGAREIYIECDKEECLRRLEASNDRDKDEWKKYIEGWFNIYTPR